MNSYFYIDVNEEQKGPFSPADLKSQNITPDTMVWCSGMPDWLPAKEIEELSLLFLNKETTPSFTPSDSTYKEQPYTSPQAYNSQPTYNQPPQNNSQGGFRGSLNSNLPIPKTWFVESILATIFCCQPFGIVAIVKANKVESLYYAGDYDASVQASEEAGKWTKIAFGVGLAFIVIVLGFYAFAIFMAISAGAYY